MVAIYSTLKQDLYVVYAGQNPDTQAPVIHVYLESAGKMDLVRWRGGSARHTGRSACPIAARCLSCPVRSSLPPRNLWPTL